MVRSHSLYPVELRGPWDHSTAEILADHQINVSIWFAASESETLNTLCVAYRASRLNFRPCVGQLRQSERRAQSAPAFCRAINGDTMQPSLHQSHAGTLSSLSRARLVHKLRCFLPESHLLYQVGRALLGRQDGILTT
jgi:hypothetical protein